MRKSISVTFFSVVATLLVLGTAVMGCSEWVLFNRYFAQERYEALDSVAEVTRRAADYVVQQAALPKGEELDALSTKLEIIGESAEAYLFLTDEDGHVLITSNPAQLAEDAVPQALMARVGDEKPYHVLSTLDGVLTEKSYVSVRKMMDDNGVCSGYLFLCSSGARLTDFKEEFWSNFFFSACIMLLCASVLTSVLMRRLTDPLQKITEAAQRFGGGDLSVRVEGVEGEGEVVDLAHTFNQMAENIQSNDNSRGQFMGNIAHELRTPMTTIKGFIDGILDGTIPPERQSHYLHIVSDEVKRLSRLVRTMLNLSRIDNGELKLRPNDFDISETVLSTVLTFEKSIDEKKIDIRGLDTLQPMQVHGDEDLLHQVVYNLVENAVKFTNTEGYISFNVSDSIDRIVVTIENSGSGIQSDELPLVFEKFYKTDKSRSQDKNGMGLGLYLVRTIIKLHGGDISVSSVVNEYTRFSFYIPKPQEPPKLKYNTGSIPVTVPVEDAVISERPKKEHHGHKDNKEPDQK